jgi:hypothetical protein
VRLEPLQSQVSNLTLWDTPAPPDLNLCQVIDNSKSRPKRLKSILIDHNLTGLSVFCTRTRIYGFHAHTQQNNSAPREYQNLVRNLKCPLLWLYFPLAMDEGIDGAWIRQRKTLSRLDNPVLIVRCTILSKICF